MPGPWEKYAQAPQGGPAPAAQFPGVIQGAPKQASPEELERLEIARQGAANAQRRLEIAEGSEQRAVANDARGSESERTAGFLAGRVKDATLRLTGAVGNDSDAANPTLGVEMARGVFGDTAANYITDPDRQTVRAAQIDIIDAALTLGTGAAYTKEQLEGYREAYFPKLGDSDEAIKSKREALRSLLVNAQTKAGRAAPDIEAALAALDALNAPQGGPGGEAVIDSETGLAVTVSDETPSPYDPGGPLDPARIEAERLNNITGEYGAMDLARHGMSLGLTDEASGIGQVISGALKGDIGNLADIQRNYELGRDAEQYRIDQAREKTGAGGTAMEVLGGGALGKINSGLTGGMQAARSLAGRGAPISRNALQSQMARSAGVEGAAAGGVGGFGYGEGLEGSATNALLGAATAGTLGYAGQRVGNAMANGKRGRVSGAEVQQAADDLRIPTIPAVTGGTVSKAVTAGARQGFISDVPVAKAVNAMEEAGGRARNRISSGAGQGLPDDQAGEVVRTAANVYSRRTSQIGGNLYERADRLAGGITVPLPQAIAKADEWLAKLAQSAEGADASLYKDVKRLRDHMARNDGSTPQVNTGLLDSGGKPIQRAGEPKPNGFTIEGIRQTRTALRESLTERGLRGSATDKVFGDILEAATGDMYDGLTAAGKQNAAGALKTANAFWRKRVETIDEVLEPVIGKNAPRSGEQIVTAIENMANPKTGNGARLRQLFQAMPESERRSVAATVINRLGLPTKGAAEVADGSGFSFNTFLTNWNNMSQQARRAIFQPETVEALNKLAVVSRGVKQAGAAANTSNTARAIGVQAVVSPVLWMVSPLAMLGGGASQYAVGKLMASPRFARWLAGAPKNATPQAQKAYIARLGGIARAEPAIANEIGLFTRAANDNTAMVTSAAAEDQQGQ
jgi:hypothetical protein